MSDTNESSKLNHRELTDTELGVAIGGRNQPIHLPAKVTIPDLKLS